MGFRALPCGEYGHLMRPRPPLPQFLSRGRQRKVPSVRSMHCHFALHNWLSVLGRPFFFPFQILQNLSFLGLDGGAVYT